MSISQLIYIGRDVNLELPTSVEEAKTLTLEKIVGELLSLSPKKEWMNKQFRMVAAFELSSLFFDPNGNVHQDVLVMIFTLMRPLWEETEQKIGTKRFKNFTMKEILTEQISILMVKCLRGMEGPSEYLVKASVDLGVQFKIQVDEGEDIHEAVEKYLSALLAHASNWEDFDIEVDTDRLSLLM